MFCLVARRRHRLLERQDSDTLLNKQIAGQLGVAEVTIKVHRHNVTKKMGVRTLADLVRLYEKLKEIGLIENAHRNLPR